MTPYRRVVTLGVAVAGLAGCAAPPVEPARRAEAAPVTPAAQARADYEQRLREQAQAADAQRRWNDAALAWELLATLRPDDPAIAERLAEARQKRRVAVAEQATRAAQATQRGDVDGASQRWLAVLALDPNDAAAAGALRKLEGERNRKAYLGRHAGTTLTRKAIAEAEAMPASAPVSRPDLDRAAAMAADGQFDSAINLLEDRYANDRRDVAARRLLADVYRREAEALGNSDPARARAALARSTRLEAADRVPAARLRTPTAPRAMLPAAATSPTAASAGVKSMP